MIWVSPSAVATANPNTPPGGGNSRQPGAVGLVYLDGHPVGTLTVTGWDTSWGFGRFEPDARFAPYAPTFRAWSRLMHADVGRPLTRPLSDELARVENALDQVKARLFFPVDGTWVDAFQLNIDGDLLEWKEY